MHHPCRRLTPPRQICGLHIHSSLGPKRSPGNAWGRFGLLLREHPLFISDICSLKSFKTGGLATGIIGCGVLLDYCSWASNNSISLEPLSLTAITFSHSQRFIVDQKVTLRPGDILFIRGGFTAACNALPRPENLAMSKLSLERKLCNRYGKVNLLLLQEIRLPLNAHRWDAGRVKMKSRHQSYFINDYLGKRLIWRTWRSIVVSPEDGAF